MNWLNQSFIPGCILKNIRNKLYEFMTLYNRWQWWVFQPNNLQYGNLLLQALGRVVGQMLLKSSRQVIRFPDIWLFASTSQRSVVVFGENSWVEYWWKFNVSGQCWTVFYQKPTVLVIPPCGSLWCFWINQKNLLMYWVPGGPNRVVVKANLNLVSFCLD